MFMTKKPWMEGPIELLNHGLSHLQQDSDFDNRMAMICIDNSIELMMKTFVGLPKRVSGKKISKSEYDEMTNSFSDLLDGIQKYASDKIVGIELGDIEWYHRIRNQLYHDGNGITVEKSKVEGYTEIAKILFSNLFDMPQEEFIEIKLDNRIGEFLSCWHHIENELKRIGEEFNFGTTVLPISYFAAKRLVSRKLVSPTFADELKSLRMFRNELVHSSEKIPTPAEIKQSISKAESIVQVLKNI